MNLAEQLILDGLQGKDAPQASGQPYLFVAQFGDDFLQLGEGNSCPR